MAIRNRDKNFHPDDMDPTEIKIKMMRTGVQQKDIANAFDPPVSKTAVHLVIENKLKSHRIRKMISKKIRIDLKRIWPSTYLYGGGPRKPGRPASQSDSTIK